MQNYEASCVLSHNTVNVSDFASFTSPENISCSSDLSFIGTSASFVPASRSCSIPILFANHANYRVAGMGNFALFLSACDIESACIVPVHDQHLSSFVFHSPSLFF